MIVGQHTRDNDLEVNVLKGKKLTNIGAHSKDEAVRLTPPIQMTLEKALAYIQDDELVEVTPKSIRLRKSLLDPNDLERAERARTGEGGGVNRRLDAETRLLPLCTVRAPPMAYHVFISHGWHDRWIAKQMARLIAEIGATPFIDVFDIKKGDRIEARVRHGLDQSNELVAPLTPCRQIGIGFGPKWRRHGWRKSAMSACSTESPWTKSTKFTAVSPSWRRRTLWRWTSSMSISRK